MNVYCAMQSKNFKRLECIFLHELFQGKDLKQLKHQHCKPCEGGVCPLENDESIDHLEQIPGWQLSEDGKSISRKIKFPSFATTMAFINAMADMSEQEGHHPDFSAGYGYCAVTYTTHAIDGLSENDFICAAKINNLLEP